MGIADGGSPISISSADGAEVSAVQSSSARRMDDYGDDETAAPQQQTAARGSMLVDPTDRAYMAKRAQEPGSQRNSLLVSGAVLAALGSGTYVSVKAYFARQEGLVKLFGSEMSYYVGNLDAMTQCAKQYKRKMGPFQFREAMFSEFLLQLGRKKPVTASVMQSVAHAANLFRFKEVKLANILVKIAKDVPRKQPGVRSKLLFYGKQLCQTAKAQEALKPLYEQMAANYRSGGQAVVGTMLNSMAEQALRDSITASGKTTELPAGWQMLGLTQEEADKTLAEMAGAAGATTAAAAAGKNEASWREFYSEPPESRENDDDDEAGKSLYQQLLDKANGDNAAGTEGSTQGSGAKAFECSNCGYTLFVAKGREWKFFGEGFKCPECGAAKDEFTEREASASS